MLTPIEIIQWILSDSLTKRSLKSRSQLLKRLFIVLPEQQKPLLKSQTMLLLGEKIHLLESLKWKELKLRNHSRIGTGLNWKIKSMQKGKNAWCCRKKLRIYVKVPYNCSQFVFKKTLCYFCLCLTYAIRIVVRLFCVRLTFYEDI